MKQMVCSVKESSAATHKRLYAAFWWCKKMRATKGPVKPDLVTYAIDARADHTTPSPHRPGDPQGEINETNLDKDARAARGLDLLLRHRGK